ncbi:uncharacterized protein BCR38DRAFT_395395 [Pseudomassariella vexata]|uniref:N-acetylgalactosaminide beta-1,3-galactosyltransferase n=1 Tax=Pseudomassariella vexata TaxID=1141098 RepID=A0A1Y2DT62_9PEZI|nr:uncharacterized protein BCR38DRAFT_395395 [Pseudomassariella vexata]ORY62461.1 hypothetical protein BCR38DRAFT_395395 [Pseudomassariella vexata]
MGLSIEQGKRLRHCIAVRPSRSRLQLVLCVSVLFIFYLLTPYDSQIRSFLRFQHNIVDDYIQHNHPSDRWLFKPQRYPIDPNQDIGIIVKTGYGTRDRVPQVLAALGNETFMSDMLVVQDYPLLRRQNYTLPNGKSVPSVDIIGWMLENKMLAGKERVERVTKYEHLADAIEAEEWFVSDGLSKAIGWELDAMKFISGLQYAWQTMPKKKWYIMADDDTFVIKESLNIVLGHLNPRKPQYLGNPIGDYKGRFAHGGSSAVISGSALSKLFDGHPDIVAEAHLESPSAVWGDKLLATTMMKIGVYLDEGYSRLFNGEPPEMTRMWADRFCVPLISFHGLGDGNKMEQVGNVFKHIREPVFWRQLGKIYGAADFETFVKEPIRINQDFVGRLDEHSTSIGDVRTVEDCIKICTRQSDECIAWTWDQAARVCHVAPWTIIGDYHEGVFSGINAPVAQRIANGCRSPPAPRLPTQ